MFAVAPFASFISAPKFDAIEMYKIQLEDIESNNYIYFLFFPILIWNSFLLDFDLLFLIK